MGVDSILRYLFWHGAVDFNQYQRGYAGRIYGAESECFVINRIYDFQGLEG